MQRGSLISLDLLLEKNKKNKGCIFDASAGVCKACYIDSKSNFILNFQSVYGLASLFQGTHAVKQA
jgi:hypothetical protein